MYDTFHANSAPAVQFDDAGTTHRAATLWGRLVVLGASGGAGGESPPMAHGTTAFEKADGTLERLLAFVAMTVKRYVRPATGKRHAQPSQEWLSANLSLVAGVFGLIRTLTYQARSKSYP